MNSNELSDAMLSAGKTLSWRQRLGKVIDQLKSLQAGIKDPTGFMRVDGDKVAASLLDINAQIVILAREARAGRIWPGSVD